MSERKSILMPFRPRARIMKTLGEELISSETVALIELVKNSYDADATNVLVRFKEPLEVGKGEIEVIDNGHGMSLKSIASDWMEPATGGKRANTRSERFQRRLLGQKGVGRLATSRLSSELELISRAENTNEEVIALFDWRAFDDETKYLDEIEVLSEIREIQEIMPGGIIDELWKERKLPSESERSKGTILRMKYLTKNWTNNEFKVLQRNLSRLVSPFKKLSNFEIRLDLPKIFSDYTQVISSPAVIKYPHYSVIGSIKADGEINMTLNLYANGIRKDITGFLIWEKDETNKDLFLIPAEKYKDLIQDSSTKIDSIQTGPFDFELRIWDRDDLENVIQQTNDSISDIRSDLDSVAGINIYRDGFRVLPYGESHNDWLRLDRRRVQKPTMRLSNNQILGFINITSDKNPNLRDQSNREGLFENQALEDLRQIMEIALNEIELERYPRRPRRNSKADTFSTPVQSLFSALNFKTLKEVISNRYPEDHDFIEVINKSQKELDDSLDEIQIVLSRYQKLVTLGTLIDIVLHDGRHPLSHVIDEAILGKEEINKAAPDELLRNLLKKFETIEFNSNLLATVFRRIEPFGGKRRNKPAQIYLEKSIFEAVSIFESRIAEMKVKIHIPKSQTLFRADSAEIQQIFINLLDNSLYWLKLEKPENREIFFDVHRIDENFCEILFSDSGPGIRPGDESRIFEAYYSTKPQGIGLGLAISGEIVADYYGGKIELIKGKGLKGATFLITIKNRI